MVFTCVEIWRGVIISKDKIIEMIHEIEPEYKSDGDGTLYDIIDDFIRLGIKLSNGVEMFPYGPCCGDDKYALLGIKLKEYNRQSFDTKFLSCDGEYKPKYGWSKSKCCGKTINDGESKWICGEYIVCDSCIKGTINGDYDVVTILEKVTECTTFCFDCNKDKCDGKNCGSETLTTKKFVDELLENVLDSIGLDTTIKNYYRLDDCLSCT